MTDTDEQRVPDAAVDVREATPDELPAVLNVLDGGALATDADLTRESIDRGAALVAVAPSDGTTDSGADGPVLGALVLDGDEIAAVAVRRRRRGQGIGTALVRAAAARRDRLTAAFRSEVRPFYESLGFAVEPIGESTAGEEPGRFRGRLPDDVR
jgi:GNAT superfamily N-acetyltransferase